MSKSNIELSIIMPSIRQQNLVSVYNSIKESTKRNFELIVIGPNNLPNELLTVSNVKSIRDFGSPVRCNQMGAILAEGKLLMTSADDAIFFKDAIDKNIDYLYSKGDNYKNVMTAKYYEGVNGIVKPLQPDLYFQINGSSWTISPYVKDDWWIFNAAIMYRSFFNELGGLDCGFNTTFSQGDLAIRSYYEGANVFLSDVPLMDCDHSQPDHKSVDASFFNHDAPYYSSKYKGPILNMVTKIDINNWKNADNIWGFRFRAS